MGLIETLKSWDFESDDSLWSPLGEGGARGGGYTFASRKALSKSLGQHDCYRLSIAVNAAVNAIARNLSKARVRLFTRTGEEINGGPCYDLFRLPIAGHGEPEVDVGTGVLVQHLRRTGRVDARGAGGIPDALIPLCPTDPPDREAGHAPQHPRGRGDVAVQLGGRGRVFIRDDFLLFDRMFNPDPCSIRGLSPLVTGAVAITAQHNAGLYNKTFFDNGAIPSHILKLPDGVPEAQRKDIERRYMSEHGVYSNNAHKTFVISGKDTEFMPLEQKFQEAAFTELHRQATLDVAMLYHVPAVEMGIYDKTRFDTAKEERQLFNESTLQPQADALTEAFQYQVVDRHFRFSPYSVARPRKPRPVDGDEKKSRLGRMIEKAADERGDSRIIVLIDTDTMPIMSQIRLDRMEHAEKLQQVYKMSANDVADYLDEDLPDAGADQPARTHVWIKNDQINITDLEMNKKLVPGLIPKPAGRGAEAVRQSRLQRACRRSIPPDLMAERTRPPPPPALTPDSRERLDKALKFLRTLRTLTVTRMVGEGWDGQLWSLPRLIRRTNSGRRWRRKSASSASGSAPRSRPPGPTGRRRLRRPRKSSAPRPRSHTSARHSESNARSYHQNLRLRCHPEGRSPRSPQGRGARRRLLGLRLR
jgi:hypothetical protein